MKEEELVEHQLEQHQRNQEIDKATQNMSIQERAGFVVGVEWADQHPRKGLWDAEKVEKVLGNLLFNKEEKIYRAYLDYDAFFEDFRKAMED